jgi:hypothetical protein
VTTSVSGGVLTVIGGTGYFYQAFTTVIGRTYRVLGDILQVGTAFDAIRKADDFNASTNVITLISSVGSANAVFVATATTTYIVLQHNFSAVDGKFDNISVCEIPGLHISQFISAARPVASGRKNLLVGTATLSTQSVTVTAIPHTITFSGGGTVTASGTYSGALTSGQTFTPTAGTLTLTVSGSVTSAQLERGSAATTYQAVVSASNYTATGFPAYLKFDGVDDALASATFAAGTLTSSMDCLIAVRREASTNYLLYGLADTNVAGRYFGAPGPSISTTNKSYGNGVGSPTVWVDGAQITVAEKALHDALTVGSWHIMEYRNLDLSAWIKIVAWGLPSYFGNGGLGDIQLFASGQDANRDKARARMAAYFGVTLA